MGMGAHIKKSLFSNLVLMPMVFIYTYVCVCVCVCMFPERDLINVQ